VGHVLDAALEPKMRNPALAGRTERERRDSNPRPPA
jgi:hypothetical protein